jgi:tetratricopeptide (TPR) repeat protein
MNKVLLSLIAFSVFATICRGQVTTEDLKGTWVKSSITYKSGELIPSRIQRNFKYIRLQFVNNKTVFRSVTPIDKGFKLDYTIADNILSIGHINYLVESYSKDSLVLVEEGSSGYNGKVLSIVLIPEIVYQKSIPMNPANVLDIANETVYIEDEKIHAKFIKDITLGDYLIDEIFYETPSLFPDEFFLASCIIDKTGSIRDIIVHVDLNPSIEKKFRKTLSSSSEFILPAALNDSNVSVLRFIALPLEIKLRTGFKESYGVYSYGEFFTNDLIYGLAEFRAKKFPKAVSYFDLCLENNPNNFEALYQRGLCYIEMNEIEKACEDWKRVKELKSVRANQEIRKHCK